MNYKLGYGDICSVLTQQLRSYQIFLPLNRVKSEHNLSDAFRKLQLASEGSILGLGGETISL